MLLVDTDTVVHLFRGNSRAKELFAATPVEQLHDSAITGAELAYGAQKSRWVEDNLMQVQSLISSWTVLPCDVEVALRFGGIKAHLERVGMKIEDPDLIIAATALVRGLTLVTSNRRHFERVPGLRLQTWL